MNQNEFEEFREEDSQVALAVVTAKGVGGDDRTLAYGYDVDRNTFHAYIHEGALYALTYNSLGQILSNASGPALAAQSLRPNKRVYPQYTDGHFARIMRDLGFPLPFTTWSERNSEGAFHGKTHLEDVAALKG